MSGKERKMGHGRRKREEKEAFPSPRRARLAEKPQLRSVLADEELDPTATQLRL